MPQGARWGVPDEGEGREERGRRGAREGGVQEAEEGVGWRFWGIETNLIEWGGIAAAGVWRRAGKGERGGGARKGVREGVRSQRTRTVALRGGQGGHYKPPLVFLLGHCGPVHWGKNPVMPL